LVACCAWWRGFCGVSRARAREVVVVWFVVCGGEGMRPWPGVLSVGRVAACRRVG
jgi:hypothetical protein